MKLARRTEHNVPVKQGASRTRMGHNSGVGSADSRSCRRQNKDVLTAGAVANRNINMVTPYPSAPVAIVLQQIADIIDFATLQLSAR